MDYIHAETLQVENNNNNNYKQFNSQEAKQARPTLATHTFACKCTHMDAHALTHTYACAHTHARMHARTHTHTRTPYQPHVEDAFHGRAWNLLYSLLSL